MPILWSYQTVNLTLTILALLGILRHVPLWEQLTAQIATLIQSSLWPKHRTQAISADKYKVCCGVVSYLHTILVSLIFYKLQSHICLSKKITVSRRTKSSFNVISHHQCKCRHLSTACTIIAFPALWLPSGRHVLYTQGKARPSETDGHFA